MFYRVSFCLSALNLSSSSLETERSCLLHIGSQSLSPCNMDAWDPLFSEMALKFDIKGYEKPDTPEDCGWIRKMRTVWKWQVTQGLRLLLDGPMISFKPLLSSNYADDITRGLSVVDLYKNSKNLPKVLFVEAKMPARRILDNYQRIGYRAMLVGKVKIDTRGIWSEYKHEGKWISSRDGDISNALVWDEDTYLLMYFVEEIDDAAKAWIKVFSSLESLKRVRITYPISMSPEISTKLIQSLDELISVNSEQLDLPLGIIYNLRSGDKLTFPSSCSNDLSFKGLIYHVDSPPEIIILCNLEDDSSFYTTVIHVGTENRCMVLRSTLEFDGHKYSSNIHEGHTSLEEVINERTVAIVYEHDKTCDGDTKALVELERLKADLLVRIDETIASLPSEGDCIQEANLRRKESRCISRKRSQDTACLERQKHIEQLVDIKAYLGIEFPAIPYSRQIMKIKEYMTVVQSHASLFTSHHWWGAMFKLIDKHLPMAFENYEGSCFLNAALQVLFSLSRFRDQISSIEDHMFEIKEALKVIARRKYDEKSAVASSLKVRQALPDWHFCKAGDSIEVLKDVIGVIPALFEKTVFINFVQGQTAQSLVDGYPIRSDAEVIIITINPKTGVCPQAAMELTINGTIYHLIATNQAMPQHVTSKVRVKFFRWYYIDNSKAELIDASASEADCKNQANPDPTKRAIIDDQTSLLVYELRDES